MFRYVFSPDHQNNENVFLADERDPLSVVSAALTPPQMTPRLTGTLFLPDHYHYHAVLDSTNRLAMELGRDGAVEGTLVVADQQTQGRGRQGRVWVSPPGLNLYCSVLLRPAIAIAKLSQLTLLTGLVLAETLVAMGVADVVIKWPNDILIKGRKMAGILAEMATDGEHLRFVIIGVGVNLNGCAADFPSDVAERAITLAEILHKPINRSLFLAEFLQVFTTWYDHYLQAGFAVVRRRWLMHAHLEGRLVEVSMPSGVMVGEAVDMDQDGFLLVKQKEGTVSRVVAGDVAFI